MADVLAEIVEAKKAHVADCKQTRPESAVDASARAEPPPRGFAAALADKETQGRFPVITEIKKASPSAGLIRPEFDPAALARAYEAAGAACLSVLTDTPYFQGEDGDIAKARGACALPALRKDFMIDVYQVAEARALGADCILIILAAVDDALAADLEAAAFDFGMDVLVETHNREEFDRALKLKSPLLGVNNRNLKTLQVDLSITGELSASAPPEKRLISESGIGSNDDVRRLWGLGARGFLVGERLMRQPDVQAAAAELIGGARPE